MPKKNKDDKDGGRLMIVFADKTIKQDLSDLANLYAKNDKMNTMNKLVEQACITMMQNLPPEVRDALKKFQKAREQLEKITIN